MVRHCSFERRYPDASGGSVGAGGGSAVTVRPVDEQAAELEAGVWAQLEVPGSERPSLYRSILLAHAEALENPIYVAALWKRNGALGGLAIAIQNADARRPALIIGIPNSLRRHHPTGLWVAPGLDGQAVTRGLLVAFREFAHRLGLARLVLGFCPSSWDQERAADDTGLGAMIAQSQYELSFAPGGHAAYLSGLGGKSRQDALRDLRACERSGATCTVEASPTDDLLERAWAMQLDTYERHRVATYAWTRNVFVSLHERLPASQTMVVCRRDGSLLGYILCHRAGAETMAVYSGRVAEAGFPVHMALMASMVKVEAERGANLVLLGPTNEILKRRIGATEVPHVHFYSRS